MITGRQTDFFAVPADAFELMMQPGKPAIERAQAFGCRWIQVGSEWMCICTDSGTTFRNGTRAQAAEAFCSYFNI
jgi:hypothetical protein